MANKGLPPGYRLLWGLVIICGILVGTSHIFLLIGQGRWVCTEKVTTCEECEINGTQFININSTYPNLCYCTKFKTECKNEVWTRKV